MPSIGSEIYNKCKELFPLNRSLTGNGVRETLKILKQIVKELEIKEVPSGTKCFDWTIPKEWNCNDAYILTPGGKKICEFKKNNLHLVGYSIPVNKKLSLEELNDHLYSLPDLPNAIPYVTSYYNERWGFCISHDERKELIEGEYEVFIDSTLEDGNLTYGEILIKGQVEEEIFLSTYICHPSMGNNELSGMTVTIFLAKYIQSFKNSYYSYRIIFIPETIGSIMYLSKNFDLMKKNIVAGFVVTCVGDNFNYSYLFSRYGNTLADKVALHVMKYNLDSFETYSFLSRGSDERQYCSPGIDLPVCSVMRTKYGMYKEYHTSLDNLDFICEDGLNGAYNLYCKIIDALENNKVYKNLILCEPQMGKRNLYSTISTKQTMGASRNMMNVLAYADGKNDLIDIANILDINIADLLDIVSILNENELLYIVE